MPDSRAGITRVSLSTSRSPARSHVPRSATVLSVIAPPSATSSRAARRGRAGRVAMSASGRSKSKSSSFMAIPRSRRERPGPGVPSCPERARGASSTCGADRRNSSRRKPGVSAESGLTATEGAAAGPCSVKLTPKSPSPRRDVSAPPSALSM